MASLDLRPKPTSANILSKSESFNVIVEEPKTVAKTKNIILHTPPRYNVYGQEIPVGKNWGLKPKISTGYKFQVPPEWDHSPKYTTKSELFRSRRDNDYEEARVKAKDIKIRSIEELKGSQSMQQILTLKNLDSKEISISKSRKKWLEERKQNNLQDLKCSFQTFEKSRNELLSGKTAAPVTNSTTAATERHRLLHHKVNIVVEESKLNQRNGKTLWKAAKHKVMNHLQNLDLIGDVNKDRPKSPTLQWIENAKMKTRTQVLAMRRNKILEDNEKMRRTRPRCNGKATLTLAHSVTEPSMTTTTKPIKIEPRQLGPLCHVEVEENDFGKQSKLQIGANSRAELLSRRRQLLVENLDMAAKSSDCKKERGMMEKIGFLVKSSKPWWNQGKSEKDLAAIVERQTSLAAAFDAKFNRHTLKPTASNKGNLLIREKLNMNKRKGMVLEKITNHPGFDLLKHQVKRCTQKDRFTDVVIEFKLAGEQPPLDENGMSLEYNPQEHAPLFSSFSEDQLFLEKEDRKLVTRLRHEAEIQKQKSRRLPRRMYVLDCGESRSRPFTSPTQAMSQVNLHDEILDSRCINSAPSSSVDQPKRVDLLTRSGSRDKPSGTINSDLGVRTGGFQCIDYN